MGVFHFMEGMRIRHTLTSLKSTTRALVHKRNRPIMSVMSLSHRSLSYEDNSVKNAYKVKL